MTIYSAVLIGCQRVTDGQTDGRQAYSYYVLQHIADARKNDVGILFISAQLLHDAIIVVVRH